MSRAVAGPLNPFLARFCGSPPDQVGGPLELGAPIATKGEGRSGYEHPLGTGSLPYSANPDRVRGNSAASATFSERARSGCSLAPAPVPDWLT